MSYKAIAFDLDGTLLDGRRQIRPSSIDAIRAARAKGVKVIIVTGRHHSVTRPYHHQLELDTPAICCNGTYAYDFVAMRALSANPIKPEHAAHLLNLTKKHGMLTRALCADAMNYVTMDRTLKYYLEWSETLPEPLRPFMRKRDDLTQIITEQAHIYGFVVLHSEHETAKALEHDIIAEIGLSCEWFAADGFDIANHGNSKGNKLIEWAAEHGIAPSEIIAFGDNHNDTSMLSAVGLGVAMGNAADHIRVHAATVAPGDNNSDAIAETLYRHVL